MRENPWHLRHPATEHHQWFKNLMTLHGMTREWQKEFKLNEKSLIFSQNNSNVLTENSWMLYALQNQTLLQNSTLNDLLDDTTPKDFLGRLEQTIWSTQAATLQYLIVKGLAQPQNPSQENPLDLLSWKLGMKAVEARWNRLPEKGHSHLKDIFLAVHDSPFSGYPHQAGFLAKRMTLQEIQVELQTCPHQIQNPEVQTNANRLCELHAHWIRGFTHALNPMVTLDHKIQPKRCTFRWYFI